jgi:hypothetical protein
MSAPTLLLLSLAAVCDHSFFLAGTLFLICSFKVLTS